MRATEIDKVVMHDSFRPGDIVRAEVVSLGDARSYYLMTAKNELGVVFAKSATAGGHEEMTQMTLTQTTLTELRESSTHNIGAAAIRHTRCTSGLSQATLSSRLTMQPLTLDK